DKGDQFVVNRVVWIAADNGVVPALAGGSTTEKVERSERGLLVAEEGPRRFVQFDARRPGDGLHLIELVVVHRFPQAGELAFGEKPLKGRLTRRRTHLAGDREWVARLDLEPHL